MSLLTSAATFFKKFANGVLDDVIHDVGRRVVNTAGLFDFRLFLDDGTMALGEADDFAEELLIDLAENVRRQRGENVGTLRVIKALENVAQEFVVEVEAEREFVGRFVAAFLRLEVEEAGVLAGVGLLELLGKARVDAAAVRQGLEASVIL